MHHAGCCAPELAAPALESREAPSGSSQWVLEGALGAGSCVQRWSARLAASRTAKGAGGEGEGTGGGRRSSRAKQPQGRNARQAIRGVPGAGAPSLSAGFSGTRRAQLVII